MTPTDSNSARKGCLYLIPSPLGEGDVTEVIPQGALSVIQRVKTYVVEEERTVRRYLSQAGLRGRIQDLDLHVLNEHTQPKDIEEMESLFDGGNDVGLISEAGLPAVADPGALLVDLCHRKGIRVVPLCGPSSLMMALMASGLNGQRFTFKGYLPQKKEERRKAIQALEKRSSQESETQIFIETPYRNDSLLEDILQTCRPQTRVCIARGITTPDEMIQTKTVGQWRRDTPVIGKIPCVFLLLG